MIRYFLRTEPYITKARIAAGSEVQVSVSDLVLTSPYITNPPSISLPTRRTLIMLMTIRPDVKYIQISFHKVRWNNNIVKIVCQYFLSVNTKLRSEFVYRIQNKGSISCF